MKTITFYSYKGGVGRSLALSNVANRLAQFGKKVCIMDFDLEAPGLHLKFGEYIDSVGVSKGLVDYIDTFTNTGIVPADINDFVTDINFSINESRMAIALIAAGNTKSNDYWKKVCSIDWKKLFYQKDSIGVEFFLNLKEQIREQLNPDFLLIDSRTGITDISGVTMSIMADEVVLLAANNSENLEGITQMIKTLSVPNNFLDGQVPKVNFVLSRIPFFINPKDKPREANAKDKALLKINKELIDSGYESFQLQKIMVIHSDPDLELQESFKMAHKIEQDKDDYASVIGLDYLNLFEEITLGMISDSEREAFDLFMKVQSLIQKAIAFKDLNVKLKLLNEAISIDPASEAALVEMGLAYFFEMEYSKALQYFERAMVFDPVNLSLKLYRGLCYQHLGDQEKALEEFKDLEDWFPDESWLFAHICRSYYLKKDFTKALEYAEKAVEQSPRSEEYCNLLGNVLRTLGEFEKAFEVIFNALEINPQSKYAVGSLAELYAEIGNDREFYKNLEQSFSFGMNNDEFQKILEEEPVYRRFFEEERFKLVLDKYGIEIDWQTIIARDNKSSNM